MDDFEYFFKVQCTSCREVHPKIVSLNRIEELEVSGGRHGTAHLIWRCSNCKHENSAKFDTRFLSVRTQQLIPATSPASLLWNVEVLSSLNLTRGQWTCKGTDSNTTFSDVEFLEGEWFDYDEKVCE
ncbi:hypothetical protein JVT61DRAFT_5499 [Boletus reticuloceps]|uniref:DUF866-domain-containing protein n=1 Tax=Boletus reticuloceps TaxID=495285 RepID=A0A8I2YZ22_9AGAM|nr:hypothetical protein JVT61DRAFT_5499 [Boletus reticuloceps]